MSCHGNVRTHRMSSFIYGICHSKTDDFKERLYLSTANIPVCFPSNETLSLAYIHCNGSSKWWAKEEREVHSNHSHNMSSFFFFFDRDSKNTRIGGVEKWGVDYCILTLSHGFTKRIFTSTDVSIIRAKI